MRVEGVAEASPGPRFAGYVIRPGTERSLTPEQLRELVRLTRTDSGFDDSIVKRCRPGASVGFRLLHGAPAGVESVSVTELVLDFGCAKLLLGGGGKTADIHATYFDPSRGAFVAFVRRVLPDDSELSKLR
jgi:hypothetical protein